MHKSDTDHRFALDDLDLSGETLYGLARVTGSDPHDLRALAHDSWVRHVLDIFRSSTIYHNGRYRISCE